MSVCSFAQITAKKYKYIIVPVEYKFTSKPNQFQVNVLTRVLLKETGFEVFMSEGEKLPKELLENQCLALKANVIKDGGLFTTTLRFELKNCFGNTIYESAGMSKKKAYKDAYHESLKIAIHEFQTVSDQYLIQDLEASEKSIEIPAQDESIPFEEQASAYKSNEKEYWLLEQEKNYILYEDKGNTVFATLEQADRGTYAFDSATIDGAAYFDANGNLIVEYLAKNEDAVQKLEFTKQ